MKVNVCENCGKMFVTRSANKKYCSFECKMESIQIRRESMGQICWNCKNATGHCSWSKCKKPIEGWVAFPVITKDREGGIRTYNIKSCPQFIKG